jgi:threonine/homoserine/homoserine lactone efflux protein
VSVEVLNPKTAIFFLAFLPQFVDVNATFPVWLQLLVLGTVVNVIFSSADIVFVLLAGSIMDRLSKSTRVQVWMRRAGGTLLMGLGMRLAMDRA